MKERTYKWHIKKDLEMWKSLFWTHVSLSRLSTRKKCHNICIEVFIGNPVLTVMTARLCCKSTIIL